MKQNAPSTYYKHLSSQVKNYSNMQNIFVKMELDQKLQGMGEFMTDLFRDELKFTMQGILNRTSQIKKTGRNILKLAILRNADEFLDF